MATVNLGVIKPVFKGAYSNSTAYVLDNIVTSGGSSYICILASTGNAVSNATYWSQMSAAGTNGTDGTTSASDLTSGTLPIARLNSGAIVKMQHYVNSTRTTNGACSQGDFWTVTYAKSLGSGVSKLIVTVGVIVHGASNGVSGEYITIGGTQYGSFSYSYGAMSAWGDGNEALTGNAEKTNQAAGNVTIGWGCSTSAGGNMVAVINPNSTDENRNNQKQSTITVWEVLI